MSIISPDCGPRFGYHPPVADLATRADIGQLLWVGFDGTEAPAPLLARIAAGDVGAAILFARNIQDIDQLTRLIAALHDAAPADPLLVALDQEGGRVQRVRAPATVWPPMLRLGEHPDADALAEPVGRALGDELAALGFDVDFAPVLDVLTNPENPVIGDRAFATTPERVATLAGAFARGLAAAGVIPCGKHFPGHGDTHLDSHLALPRVDQPAERLRSVELAPFAALPDLPLLMTAHVVFPAFDEVPATLSTRILGDILRRELGYRGVVLSDDMEMKAIADHFGIADASVRAIRAGCDGLLLCHAEALQHEVHEALLHAAEKDSGLRARIGEAAARVRALKQRHAADWRDRPRPGLDRLGAHAALAERITRGG